jgi:hypothetical protein
MPRLPRGGRGALPYFFPMTDSEITARLVPPPERNAFVGKLFGIRFYWVESFVFDTASSLSEQYEGGFWEYLALAPAGFYMRPTHRLSFSVVCSNGFEGEMSSDAFGITACLYAYSALSFSPDEQFAQCCADHYHRLRLYALGHSEMPSIIRAID